MGKNEEPATPGQEQTGIVEEGFGSDCIKLRQGTKEFVVLEVLASGRSLNRFEAIRLHDTALNSTISTLQSKGLSIHREFEQVPCCNGTKTVRVCRYSLPAAELPRARQMLGLDGGQSA